MESPLYRLCRIITVIFLSPAVFHPQESPTITLTEVMFRPSASNSEFIEIFNLSDSDTLDLHGYRFRYHTSKPDSIKSRNGSLLLPPLHYAVIFENDYNIQTGIYTDIPEDALLLKIGDNAFGSSGMSNSSDRTIYLINAMNDTIDTYTYSADNSAGISDEKVDYNSGTYDLNWLNGKVLNGTPGKINSVSRKQHDLSVIVVKENNEPIFEGDSLFVSAVIKNIGVVDADNFTVTVFDDINLNSKGEISETIMYEEFTKLEPADSSVVLLLIESVENRDYHILTQADYPLDQDTSNNSFAVTINVLPQPRDFGDVVINEIMYKPHADEPEWIELFNNAGDSVNLKNWQIEDRSKKNLITVEQIYIEPGGYIVVAEDESILDFHDITSPVIQAELPSLNNSGDKLMLADSLDIKIDSVEYFSAWGGSTGGISLERINPSQAENDSLNWSSSISPLRATPGRVNSVSPKRNDAAIDSIFHHPSSAIENDDFSISILVKNMGAEYIIDAVVHLYEDMNMDSIRAPGEKLSSAVISSIAPNQIGMLTTIPINRPAGNYRFIVFTEFEADEYPENNNMLHDITVGVKPADYNSIIINEIMYKPDGDEPEWLELYNTSAEAINLNDWSVADLKDTVKLEDSAAYICSGDFAIISDDESIIEYYDITSPVFTISLPSLNNSHDNLKLLDPYLRVIDSVNYKFSWGGSSGGTSLERRMYSSPGNDSTNWSGSISASGATPGAINSVVPYDYDIKISSINLLDEHAIVGEEIELVITIKNAGVNLTGSYSLDIFHDINLDSLTNISELEMSIPGSSIIPGDSVKHNFRLTGYDEGSNKYIAVISSAAEEYQLNNYFYFQITGVRLNEVRNDIIINEIMYSPVSPEPEWIELYNNSDKTVDLNSYMVSDRSDTSVSINENYTLRPDTYAVVAGDSSMLEMYPGISNIIIHDLPLLNNTGDRLMILDSLGRIIDSLWYYSNWGGGRGISLERIIPAENSADSSNWASSLSSGTPGFINSVTPRDYDLALCSLIVNPENPILNDEISLQAVIKNRGLISAENFTVKYFVEDFNEYVMDEITYDLLETEDSAVISFNRSFSLSGTAAIITSIEFEQDENPDNNTDTTKVMPGYPQSTIIITEFMSRPTAGNSEWIELYNSTRNAINIKGWTVSDVSPRIVNKRILEYDHYVNPLSYFIVARDTSNLGFDINGKLFEVPFGSLGNSEDGIIITDMNGNLIDSIFYTRNWQISKGQSLERRNYMVMGIDSSNWLLSLAVSGGTPGMDNSVSSLHSYAFNQVVINEIMFAPSENGTEFIELMNISNDAVDLGGWIFEESGGNSSRISHKMVLPQGSYFIFAADSSILHNYYNTTQLEYISILNRPDLGLSNSGESIVVSDALGNIMDSLTYSDSWHNRNITIVKNRSLERINPYIAAGNGNNWSSSAADEGATPGRENSIFTRRAASAGSMNISPNPFSPDNDGFEDFAIISYKLKAAPAQIRVKIYDDHGRLTRTLANNVASGLSGDILFDGLNDSGSPLRIGMYIVFLEAIEPLSGEVETMKKIVVVARPL